MAEISRKSLVLKGFSAGLTVLAATVTVAACSASADTSALVPDYGTNSPASTIAPSGAGTPLLDATSATRSATAGTTTSASPTAQASKAAKTPKATKSASKPATNTGPKRNAAGPPEASTTPHLSVSKTTGLSNGDKVTVTGSGFDVTKGIYVAFCVMSPPGELPTPCGGGPDTDGNSGASQWISSNPPPYGKALAIPYSANGSFSVTVRVSDMIGDINCRVTQCAVVSRADHLRASDRSQDVLIPITFGAHR